MGGGGDEVRKGKQVEGEDSINMGIKDGKFGRVGKVYNMFRKVGIRPFKYHQHNQQRWCKIVRTGLNCLL